MPASGAVPSVDLGFGRQSGEFPLWLSTVLGKVPRLAKPGKIMAKVFQSMSVRDSAVQRDIKQEEQNILGAVKGT